MIMNILQLLRSLKNAKVIGRKKDFAKKKRLTEHTIGNDCKSSRHKCLEQITGEERDDLILHFNTNYKSKDEQDAYLATMVKPATVKRHSKQYSCDLKEFS